VPNSFDWVPNNIAQNEKKMNIMGIEPMTLEQARQ
jgi:hypothetical protein